VECGGCGGGGKNADCVRCYSHGSECLCVLNMNMDMTTTGDKLLFAEVNDGAVYWDYL